MVCEMAGSYDLLVPLMLGEGIAYVALPAIRSWGPAILILLGSGIALHLSARLRRRSPAG